MEMRSKTYIRIASLVLCLIISFSSFCAFGAYNINAASSIAGDVDENGSVNATDLTQLIRFLSGWQVSVAHDNADLDNNGRLNNRDAILLIYKLLESGGSDSFTSNEKTVDKVLVANGQYEIKAEYTSTAVILSAIGDGIDSASSVSFYISPYSNTELTDSKAYLVSVTPATKAISAKKYASRKFGTSTTLGNASCEVKSGSVSLSIPYSSMGVSKSTCALAFFPSVKTATASYSYRDVNPYMTSKYAETWLCLDVDGRIYYNDVYANRQIENWTKPSYVDQDVVLNAGIKEETVEEAIIAIAIAESKGATGFTLRLENLATQNNVTKEALTKITHSTKYPIMALYYNGNISQQARLDGLALAAESGAAIVDLQGFMGHSGSTSSTQTPANVKLWESKGFDMSFVDAMPAETPISEAAIKSQTEYINKIHALGSEVLVSTHASAVYSAEQALAYAEFVAARGADIVKIVGYGQNAKDVAECVKACKLISESDKLKDTKVSYHLSGHSSAYITRVLCPTFYGSFIYFCYPELTEWQDANQLDLDMAAQAYKLREGSDISIENAIKKLKDNIDHSQLTKLITNYNNAPDKVGYIYANSSLIDNNWTFSSSSWKAQIRDSGNTNSYTTRSHAYDPEKDGANAIFAAISGSYVPYVSSTRQPRLGVFIGNASEMLAFTYNDSTKKLELCALREGWYFGASCHDPEKKDALASTTFFTSSAYSTSVGTGGKITLGMQIVNDKLELYFSEGGSAMTKVAEIPLSSVLSYIPTENCHAGVLSEIYMGSSSSGQQSTITFSSVSYSKKS